MYLVNIAFVVNLLTRYSFAPTWRHWHEVKQILHYLHGTTDIGLFYLNKSKPRLIGYADAGYLSDPHKAKSQTGYVFTYGHTINHSKILAIHEVSRECNWLTSMIHHNVICL